MSEGKVVWDAPENKTTLSLKMSSGSEVTVTVSGYGDELELLAALTAIGRERFVSKLAGDLLAIYEEDDIYEEGDDE